MKNFLINSVKNEKFFLYFAILIGIVLQIVYIAFSYDLYRDSAGVYCPMARSLQQGNYAEAFNPGIPCLNVIMTKPLTLCGIKPETALLVISAAFYIASIPFVYLLLHIFLPGRLASLGSLCFACTPKIIRFSCTPLVDSGKIFFVTAALYFMIKLIRAEYKSFKYALLFGLMLGGMTLSRSEGFANAFAFCAIFCLYWLLDSIRAKKIRPVLRSAVILFPWQFCIFSRIQVNAYFCNVVEFDSRISEGLAEIYYLLFMKPYEDWSASAGSLNFIPNLIRAGSFDFPLFVAGLMKKAASLLPAFIVLPSFLFFRFAHSVFGGITTGLDMKVSGIVASSGIGACRASCRDIPAGYWSVSWWRIINQNIRAEFEVYFGFFVLGLLAIVLPVIFRKKGWDKYIFPNAEIPAFQKWDKCYWIFILVPVSNAVIFKMQNMDAYRYFLLNVPCLMIFVIIGGYFIWKWFAKFLPRLMFIPALGIAVFLSFLVWDEVSYSLWRNPRNQYLVGKQIAALLEEEKDTARVLFTDASQEWYYSGLKRAVPIEVDHNDIKVVFDYVLQSDRQDNFKNIRERRDLEEIPLENAGHIRLFKRKDL